MMKASYGILCAAVLLVSGCGAESVSNDLASPVVEATPAAPTASSPTEVVETPVAEAPATSASSPTASPEAPVTTSSTAGAIANTVVIPGERVGPVTPSTTRQELANLFGEANLSDQDIDVGEGMTEPGTVVNPGSDRAFTITWTDETRSKPSSFQNFGAAWKTPQGIGIGTNFAELQQELGAFQLYGFGWDYGGSIVLAGSQLNQYDGLLILRVQPPADAPQKVAQAYEAVAGETLYPSTDPNFQSLDLRVQEMIVFLTRPEA